MQPEPHLHPHPPTPSPQNGVPGEGRPTSSIYLIFSGGNKPSFSAGGICNILQDGNVCSHFIWLLILLPQSPVRQTDRQTVGKQTNTGLGQILANLYTYTIYIYFLIFGLQWSLHYECGREKEMQFIAQDIRTGKQDIHIQPPSLAVILASWQRSLQASLQVSCSKWRIPKGFPILLRETK